jgi:branched-chain amino acid transport system ATP-binding protein
MDDVHTFYGNSHILHGVSLIIRPGQVLGLLGRNGVGKTTTLQSILGLPAPRQGVIRLRGEVISGEPPYAIVQRGVSWVPQSHRIFPTLSVRENLTLAAAKGRPGPWNLAGVLELFPRLQERITARGGALSGGEQQMLAVARALVQNPDLILMDEPSEGLSPRIVDEVGGVIARVAGQGCAVLLVEQNLAFALRVATDILVMNKGQIVFSGMASELSRDPDACRRYLSAATSARAH